LEDLYFLLRPRGWADLERRDYSRIIQDRVLTQADPVAVKFHTRQTHEHEEWIKAQSTSLSWSIRRLLIALSLPAIGGATLNTARTQATQRQGALACALELHRRQHGAFPERLDELAVDPILRQDPVGGGGMIYRREPDGGYLLYSRGWNENDDGGAYDSKKRQEGDWPWRMPGLASTAP
jgi:hypothetical protein